MCVGREGSAADHIYLYVFFEERLDFLLGLGATVMGQKGRSHTRTISVEVSHHTFSCSGLHGGGEFPGDGA